MIVKIIISFILKSECVFNKNDNFVQLVAMFRKFDVARFCFICLFFGSVDLSLVVCENCLIQSNGIQNEQTKNTHK